MQSQSTGDQRVKHQQTRSRTRTHTQTLVTAADRPNARRRTVTIVGASMVSGVSAGARYFPKRNDFYIFN